MDPSTMTEVAYPANPFVSWRIEAGGREPAHVQSLKSMLIDRELKKLESDYSYIETLKFHLATWNVDGQKPTEALDPWLFPVLATNQGDSNRADVIVAAFQEVDLSPEAILFGSSSRGEPWEEAVRKCVTDRGLDYEHLATKQLVGMLIIVYVRRQLKKFIREVEVDSVGVGIMSTLGNKGCVAVRFQVYDSKICIVNAHLNAFQDNVQRRNQDFRDIIRRLAFPSRNLANSQPTLSLASHDVVLWIGDLNYRLQLTREEVLAGIAANDFVKLYLSDQLYQQVTAKLAFEDFHEASIEFPPTYKFDLNSAVYDTSDKARIPSWCDRVLWSGERVSMLNYSSCDVLRGSDHRPVFGFATVGARVIDVQRQIAARLDVVKRIDHLENESRPDAALSSNHLDFSDVRYGVSSTLNLQIKNTGLVPLRYEFIPKLDQKAVCKPWLWVSPQVGLLGQGESTDVFLTVTVDSRNMPHTPVSLPSAFVPSAGNDGSGDAGHAIDSSVLSPVALEDILVLRLEHGKDYYVSVSGTYLPSCFGLSLELLVLIAKPIRVKQDLLSFSMMMPIPKEVWRMVDYLYPRISTTRSMFLQSGIATEMDQIRELLDTKATLETFSGSAHSVAESLIRFLESIEKPLVLSSLYTQCIEATNPSDFRQVLSYLPPAHYHMLLYLISFLREVLLVGPKIGVSASELAVVFSSAILRPPDGAPIPGELRGTHREKASKFVERLLTAKPALFLEPKPAP